MLMILGNGIEDWNGHNAGEKVSMRESVARDFMRRGLARFSDVEEVGKDELGESIMEPEPPKRDFKSYDRALKARGVTTKAGEPVRRKVKRRVIAPPQATTPKGGKTEE